ncbi:MAG TPA: hypothetical protein VFA55_09670, partial [Candidatus Kapabacteria bacterium]|nr:hypothetical protein [Candidatus Kapabacteria bacterium]
MNTFFTTLSARRRLICTTGALSFVLLFHNSAVSQTATLSGVVNTYTKVTALSAKSVTVNSAAGFAAGDRVLIIQMDGAVINLANSAAYGAITEYGSAGSYEFASINSVKGATITFKNDIVNAYDPSQSVQLIRIPSYTDATVTGTLSAQPWNGSTGGVVALFVSGALTLKANINADGAGFRGGATDNVNRNFFGGNRTCDSSDYFFTQTGQSAASKGEGIATLSIQSGYPIGKGSAANAGGGANTEEGGGGGGGNYSDGGNGGDSSGSTQCPGCGGIGGGGLLYSNA